MLALTTQAAIRDPVGQNRLVKSLREKRSRIKETESTLMATTKKIQMDGYGFGFCSSATSMPNRDETKETGMKKKASLVGYFTRVAFSMPPCASTACSS